MNKTERKTKIKPTATIKTPDLRQAIERVLFATSDEKTRYLLNVVRFSSDGSLLKLEATDGRRASSARIQIKLPRFEFLVSIADCKAIKKLCARKRDTIKVSGDSRRRSLTFLSSTGESVTVGNDPDVEGAFAPVEHVLEKEPVGTIPVLDAVEFDRAVKLAVTVRRDGERVSKIETSGNLIHLISTPRRMTVFGKARWNGHRVVTYLDSDERATPVSLKVNGSFLLELLRVLPKSEPYELKTWNNGTDGIAYVSENFSHYLCGVHIRKAA